MKPRFFNKRAFYYWGAVVVFTSAVTLAHLEKWLRGQSEPWPALLWSIPVIVILGLTPYRKQMIIGVVATYGFLSLKAIFVHGEITLGVLVLLSSIVICYLIQTVFPDKAGEMDWLDEKDALGESSPADNLEMSLTSNSPEDDVQNDVDQK